MRCNKDTARRWQLSQLLSDWRHALMATRLLHIAPSDRWRVLEMMQTRRTTTFHGNTLQEIE